MKTLEQKQKQQILNEIALELHSRNTLKIKDIEKLTGVPSGNLYSSFLLKKYQGTYKDASISELISLAERTRNTGLKKIVIYDNELRTTLFVEMLKGVHGNEPLKSSPDPSGFLKWRSYFGDGLF